MNKTYLNFIVPASSDIQVVNYLRSFERRNLEPKYHFHWYFSVTFLTAFYVVRSEDAYYLYVPLVCSCLSFA